MPFLVQGCINDHALAVTTATAKEAFAKAVKWHATEARLVNEMGVLDDIVTLERDPEKEPQGRYGLIEGRRANTARRQMQLIAAHVLETCRIG